MPDYDKFTKVLARQDGRLLTISLNRPERMNAVGDGLEEQFSEALQLAAGDDSVGAILLRGEGRAFCVGGDVKDFNAAFESEQPQSPARRAIDTLNATRILETILAVPQPIVAAVHGYAMGLGATIALFCDVVLVTEDAKIADSHVSVGLVAGDGGAVIWPLLMPLGAARYYLLTGEPIGGAEAARLGLALKATPAGELDDEAGAIARRLGEGAPMAIQGTKATLNKIVRDRMALNLESGLLLEGATFVSEDHQEASAAFVQKRAPKFSGR